MRSEHYAARRHSTLGVECVRGRALYDVKWQTSRFGCSKSFPNLLETKMTMGTGQSAIVVAKARIDPSARRTPCALLVVFGFRTRRYGSSGVAARQCRRLRRTPRRPQLPSRPTGSPRQICAELLKWGDVAGPARLGQDHPDLEGPHGTSRDGSERRGHDSAGAVLKSQGRGAFGAASPGRQALSIAPRSVAAGTRSGGSRTSPSTWMLGKAATHGLRIDGAGLESRRPGPWTRCTSPMSESRRRANPPRRRRTAEEFRDWLPSEESLRESGRGGLTPLSDHRTACRVTSNRPRAPVPRESRFDGSPALRATLAAFPNPRGPRVSADTWRRSDASLERLLPSRPGAA